MVKIHPYYSKKSNNDADNFNILCGVVLGLLCYTVFCVAILIIIVLSIENDNISSSSSSSSF
jgi:hypothetical protein